MKQLQRLLSLTLLALLVAACGGGQKQQEGTPIGNLAEQYAGKRIGVLLGSAQEDFGRKYFTKSTIETFDIAPTALAALQANKIDAALVNTDASRLALESNNRLYVIQSDITSTGLGFAFKKGNDKLRNRFNQFLNEMKEAGQLDTLYARWEQHFDTAVMPDESDGDAGTINFGTTGMDNPFSTIRNNKLVGYDVDLAYRFAQRFGYRLKVNRMDFGGLIPGIVSGKLDMIGNSIQINEARAQNVDFSEPYFSQSCDLIGVRSNNQPSGTDGKYRSAADLANIRFGIMTGSVYDALIRQHFPHAKRVYFERAADVTMALMAGKCDAMMMEHSLAVLMEKENPAVKILIDGFEKQDMAFAFNSKNTALEQKFSDFIRELKASGEMKTLLSGWENHFDTMSIPKLTGDGSGGTLRFGCSLEGAPASAIRHGEPVGTNVDIVYRFANKYNMKVQLTPLPFTAMLASVETGKCDIIGDNISVSEERKKRMLFSEPYAADPIDILVLKEKMADAAPAAFDGIAGLSTKERLDLLKDKRIGMVTGDEAEAFFKTNYPDADYSFFNTVTDLAVALNNNKVDAGVAWETVTPGLLKINPNLALYADGVYKVDYSFCFNKKDAALCDSVSATIRRLRASGELEKIQSDWTERWETMPLPRLTGDGSGGTIVVGATMTDVPCSFIKEGQPAGMDVDIIYRYASAHNLKVEFRKFDFGGMLQALSTGRADMLCGEIAVTSERQKQYLFSDSYQHAGTTVLVTRAFMQSEESAVATVHVDEEPGWWESLKKSFDSNLIQEKRYMLIVDGLWVTLIISVLSALLGTLFGAGICFLRMNRRPLLNGIARGYITLVRGTPILVLLMIMYYVIFAKVNINAIPVAIFAFAMNFAAYVSEMFRTAIESIPGGQTEAGIAMGFTKVKTFLYIILPQAVRRVLPVYKGEFISLVKTTSIVGYIAVEDLTKASDIIRSRTFDAFFPLILVAIIYFFIAWAFTLLLDQLDAGTDPKRKLSKKKKS
ncbi:MAG: ABC transporter permease subunit [Prevotellaceae bacterium]|jgi:polar amino acid transport system substrate-binding protein|nr:ABC transporter permease subunit [Prevotellaceae bacterium]